MITMDKKIPIGVSDFGTLINPKKHYQFVDKTLFIQEILDDGAAVLLITRPRRWGKTLNLSMLEYFLAPQVLNIPTKGMFNHLAIANVNHGRYLSSQGQFPVILISFKDIKENQFLAASDRMRVVIQNTFRKYKATLLHSDLLDDHDKRLVCSYLEGTADLAALEASLLRLSELLYRVSGNQKVYILIDEYDTPLNHAYQHNYLEEMTRLMKNLLSSTLKDNPYLEKGIMTGVLRISKDSMLSGLNNVKVCSILHHAYTPHFGFTDSEVECLFVNSKIPHTLDAIRQYYNGYRIGDQRLYNPWSIMQCLDGKGALQPYWLNTADDNLLRNTLLHSTPAVKQQLHKLISSNEDAVHYEIDTSISDTIRFENIVIDENVLWSLLLSTGYLTISHKNADRFEIHTSCRLTIPNQEVQLLFLSVFKDWLSNELTRPVYELFLQDLIDGRIETFTHKLEHYLITYGSYHDFISESNYHTFMLGLLCGLTEHYWLYSNIEAGHGRADMILVPRHIQQYDTPHAIILEFKRSTTTALSRQRAIDAVDQIDTKQYQAFINRYATNVQKILNIGFVFNGKHVASHHRWSAL